MSFFLFRKGVQGWFTHLTKDRKRLNNLMIKFNNISVTELAIIIAIPFTPAFLVNIAAGLSDMSKKKFIISLLIGKIGLVYFWGYIGTSIVESFKNPIILVKIFVILLVTYLILLIFQLSGISPIHSRFFSPKNLFLGADFSPLFFIFSPLFCISQFTNILKVSRICS